MKTKAVVAAAAAILWSSSSARPFVPFVLHERLDGALVSFGPPINSSGKIELRLNVALGNPKTVTGRFRCKTIPSVLSDDPRRPEASSTSSGPCFGGRVGTLTNVALTQRTTSAFSRDFFIDDFDADLLFSDVPVSCHITGAAPSIGNTFPSVTAAYACVDAAGRGLDTGTFVVVRHCR